MKRKILILLGLLVILLVPAGTAFAQDAAPAVCEGETVSGTVVAVDEETGALTVEDEDGIQCIVENPSDYEHPITSLLDAYFGDVNTEDVAGAFETLVVCAVQDADTLEWSTVELEEDATCEDAGGTEVTVSAANEDGTFTAADEAGEEFVLTFDEEDEDAAAAAAELADALDALVIEWSLNEEGAVTDAGDDMNAYREDGVGYGELVKLYAIAAESQAACEAEAEEAAADAEAGAEGEDTTAGDDADPADDGEEEPCGVTVEELVALVQDGASMGQLFQLYGKPSMLGVGHVRQALSGSTDGTTDTDDGDAGDGEEECKSGGGHDMGTHTGHVDCVNVGGDGGSGLPSGDKDDDDGDDD